MLSVLRRPCSQQPHEVASRNALWLSPSRVRKRPSAARERRSRTAAPTRRSGQIEPARYDRDTAIPAKRRHSQFSFRNRVALGEPNSKHVNSQYPLVDGLPVLLHHPDRDANAIGSERLRASVALRAIFRFGDGDFEDQAQPSGLRSHPAPPRSRLSHSPVNRGVWLTGCSARGDECDPPIQWSCRSSAQPDRLASRVEADEKRRQEPLFAFLNGCFILATVLKKRGCA